MKKLVFLLSALSLMACNKNEDNENVDVKETSIPAGAFYKSVAVDVPAGQKAEVYVGGVKTSEICGPTSTEVLVPANAMAVDGLRAVDINELTYEVRFASFSGAAANVHTMQSTIAFEDLRKGIDGDYNDFIVDIWSNMKVEKNGSQTVVKVEWEKITPIAMGAEYDMAFGCKVALFKGEELVDEKDVVISEDVRRDYFGGTVGLLNTIKDGLFVKTESVSRENEEFVSFTNAPDGVTCHLIYYIDVRNTGWRHYAVAVAKTSNNEDFDLSSLDGAVVGASSKNHDIEHAMGLYMPSSLKFAYPVEKMSIFEAYPDFKKWLANPKFNPFVNAVEGKVYTK